MDCLEALQDLKVVVLGLVCGAKTGLSPILGVRIEDDEGVSSRVAADEFILVLVHWLWIEMKGKKRSESFEEL